MLHRPRSLILAGVFLLAALAIAVGLTVNARQPAPPELSVAVPGEAAAAETDPSPTTVPAEVVALVEGVPDDLEGALAPEAFELGVELDDVLPEGAELVVEVESWSALGGSATLLADLLVPDEPNETHVVVLADVEGRWLISGTLPVEP